MKQFGRQLKLIIGNEDESIEITNLRVKFDVKKTLSSEPNPAVITVYNLNKSHQNVLTSKVFNRILLSVGYEQLRLIYSGDIIEAKIIESDRDVLCELTCGDGFTAYTSTIVNKTLSAGQSDADIVTENAQAMGLNMCVIDLPNDRRLPRGKVMFGDPRELLHKIAKNNHAEWSIQDGQLTVLPKNKVLADNEGFVLSQETGLIGKPEKSDEGLNLTCLCNPALQIGGLVRVESITPEYSGDYKITAVHHSGDFMDSTWHTKLVCIGGEFNKVEK